jgi:hypothetical protein
MMLTGLLDKDQIRSKELFNAEKAKKKYDRRCKDQRTYIVFHKNISENLR